MAAPKDSGGRSRTSTCMPLRRWKLILLSPLAITSMSGGYLATYGDGFLRGRFGRAQALPVTRMSRSPTVSRPRRSDPAGVILSMPGNFSRYAVSFSASIFGGVDQEAAADAAVVFDGLEELGFVLLAHARQFANFSLARQFLDAIDVADLVGAPDQSDGLGAEALNLQQLQHRRVIFLAAVRSGQSSLPSLKSSCRLRQHALADAGNREHLLGIGDECL